MRVDRGRRTIVLTWSTDSKVPSPLGLKRSEETTRLCKEVEPNVVGEALLKI